MWRSILLLVSVLAVAALAAGCGPAAGRTVKIEDQDAGQTVELDKGDRLEIALPGNITTGYTWEVATIDGAILKQLGEPEFEADSNAVGAGGIITLGFEAAGSGQTNVRLVYHRSFEQGVDPLETYEVNVIVK